MLRFKILQKECYTNFNEFYGTLPDHRKVGYYYMSINGEIDQGLVEQLQDHHYDTASVVIGIQRYHGHKEFDVFLNNGSMGKLEANSYCVSYKELGHRNER